MLRSWEKDPGRCPSSPCSRTSHAGLRGAGTGSGFFPQRVREKEAGEAGMHGVGAPSLRAALEGQRESWVEDRSHSSRLQHLPLVPARSRKECDSEPREGERETLGLPRPPRPTVWEFGTAWASPKGSEGCRLRERLSYLLMCAVISF